MPNDHDRACYIPTDRSAPQREGKKWPGNTDRAWQEQWSNDRRASIGPLQDAVRARTMDRLERTGTGGDTMRWHSCLDGDGAHRSSLARATGHRLMGARTDAAGAVRGQATPRAPDSFVP